MEWNDIAETKYESVIKALNKAYPEYDKWFTDAGRYWPRDYYFKNGSYIRVVGDTEPDYTTLISNMNEKVDQHAESIKPTPPTVSFQDLYGESQ